jgi:ABC-type Mn2+/Zn2+ transport system permease subunit
MLLAPAGCGALLARRVPAMMLWGVAIGSLSVYVGLLFSYHFNLAAGASVVVVAVAIFFVIFTVQAIVQALSQRRASVVIE